MEDKMLEFMNKLIDEDLENFDESKFEMEQKYATMFGHGIPREMIPPSITEDDIMNAVGKCIRSQKDELIKLLGIETE